MLTAARHVLFYLCVFRYALYISDGKSGVGDRLLMVAQKRKSKTSNYTISLDRQDLNKPYSERSDAFLGKLRATTRARDEYVLYDRGLNPDGLYWEDAVANHTMLRAELACVVYRKGKDAKPTRKMEIALPSLLKGDDKPFVWRPQEADEEMRLLFKRVRTKGAQNVLHKDKICCLHNHASRFDPISACLVEFKGRATAPSVKNFQTRVSPPEDAYLRAQWREGVGKDEDLPSGNDVGRVVLQLGRVGKDKFNMDFQHPLSPLQAFGICLSRFDTKHAEK